MQYKSLTIALLTTIFIMNLQGHRSGRIPPLPDFSCPCFFFLKETKKKRRCRFFFVNNLSAYFFNAVSSSSTMMKTSSSLDIFISEAIFC